MRGFFDRLGKKAQASTEYVLMMAFAIGIGLLIYRSLIKPGFANLSRAFSNRIDSMWKAENLHRFRMKR